MDGGGGAGPGGRSGDRVQSKSILDHAGYGDEFGADGAGRNQ